MMMITETTTKRAAGKAALLLIIVLSQLNGTVAAASDANATIPNGLAGNCLSSRAAHRKPVSATPSIAR